VFTLHVLYIDKTQARYWRYCSGIHMYFLVNILAYVKLFLLYLFVFGFMMCNSIF